MTREELEVIDSTITYLINIVQKQIEDPLRRVSYSETKLIILALLLDRKEERKVRRKN